MSLVPHIIKKFFRRISLFCQDWAGKPVSYTRMVLSGLLTCSLLATPFLVKSNRSDSIPTRKSSDPRVVGSQKLENLHVSSVYLPSIDDSLPNLKYSELTSFDNKLYCTNTEGSFRDNGMIFSLDPADTTYKVVRSFTAKDGVNSTGTLTKYDNKLYGITEGIYGKFFSWNPTDSSFSVLKITGGSKISGGFINYYSGTSLTEYNNKLFGVSGSHRETIFSLEPDYSRPNTSNAQSFWKIKVHYNSNTKKPGVEKFNQISQLTVYGDTLYGYGMVSNKAVIFSLDPATDSIKIINKFWPIKSPTGSLTVCNDTLLYGMDRGGYGEKGTIFLLNPANNTFELLHNFIEQDGINPTGSLTFYDGKLYGMTSNGGQYRRGVIFSLDPVTNEYEALIDFMDEDGLSPRGSLTVHEGKLYGMTTFGGSKGKGVFFSFDPTNSDYVLLRYSKEKVSTKQKHIPQSGSTYKRPK